MNEIVADLRPLYADALVADVMAHAGGARREDRQVRAALALQADLVRLQALANLVVAHLQRRARRHRGLVLGSLGLFRTEAVQVLGLGGVVAVTIDDHEVRRFRWGAKKAAGAYESSRDCQTVMSDDRRRPSFRAAALRPRGSLGTKPGFVGISSRGAMRRRRVSMGEVITPLNCPAARASAIRSAEIT